MEENKYQDSIDLAKMIDQWRVMPRLMIVTYIVILYQSVQWFMGLDNPNNAQAGLISVIVGAGAHWFKSYVGTRGDGNT
jgi:hypothetical protein